MPEDPILCIDHHVSFINVLFGLLRAGRELRVQPIEFFTTNYDTLIEDALAFQAVPYTDGFCGGAVAHWDPSTMDGSNSDQKSPRAKVTKIHGSIDWTRLGDRIIRRRISDAYPEGQTDLLIYPQALKYELTKREPFDTLFAQLRKALNRTSPQVLFVCGYGFGDEHIDQEICFALSREDSQLTLVAFSQKMMVDLLTGSLGHSVSVSIWLRKMVFGAEPMDHLINRPTGRYTIGGHLGE